MNTEHNLLAPGALPVVTPEVWRLRPDFAAMSIVVLDGANGTGQPWIADRLAAAAISAQSGPAWAVEHLASWQAAYKSFGAKPQRTPCSAEALRRRAERDGRLPAINAVVDLYNAISIAYALPVGGEDLAAYRGLPRLTIANGDEPFETTKDGAPSIDYPDPGEVIWRDDHGVTCRRWNWRQGPRTRILETTTEMWFLLERLDPMPIQAMTEATSELISGLRRLAPNAVISSNLLIEPNSVGK